MIPIKILENQETPVKQVCFGGAWYHKVMSMTYPFYGIEGIITIPMPFIRRYENYVVKKGLLDLEHKNLDVSSVYMGGHAKDESDVGLALFRAQLNQGISVGACVYRPFWRYITDEFEDIGGYDLLNNRNYAATLLSNHQGMKNIYAQYHPSFSEYYYLPGDTVKLSLFSPKPNFMQMMIEVVNISKLPYAIKMRKKHHWKQPKTFLSPIFSSKGHGTDLPKTYKRVNAIDQVKNEGKEAIVSNTQVLNAHWRECFLYYKEDGKLYKTPMNDTNSITMQCPNPLAFSTTKINENTGSQMISICPRGVIK